MLEIKIPLQEFALKMQGGGLMHEGGAYLRDTTVMQLLYFFDQIAILYSYYLSAAFILESLPTLMWAG